MSVLLMRLLGSLLVLFLATAASAERRVALVVANAAYSGAPLGNPTVDAGMVRETLTRLGFEVTVAENVGLGAFDAAIDGFEATAKGADVALFYFAGHGFAISDGATPRNYLMAVDADVTSKSDRVIRAGGVPLDEVIAGIGDAAKTVLVFVDACRNDPAVARSAGGRGRGLARIDDSAGAEIFVGLSTRPGDTADDGVAGAGSPFARAFAANIGTPGLRLDDAFTRVRLAVEAETAQDQRPEVVRYDLQAPVVLATLDATTANSTQPPQPEIAPVPPVLPPAPPVAAEAREAPCASARGDFEFARDIGTPDAYRAFLATHPACPPYSAFAEAGLAKATAPPPRVAAVPPKPAAEEPAAPPPPVTWRVRRDVSDGILNMRSGPGVTHGIIVAIPAGSGGLSVGRCVAPDDGKSRSNWCRVRWRGKSGWVSSVWIVRN